MTQLHGSHTAPPAPQQPPHAWSPPGAGWVGQTGAPQPGALQQGTPQPGGPYAGGPQGPGGSGGGRRRGPGWAGVLVAAGLAAVLAGGGAAAAVTALQDDGAAGTSAAAATGSTAGGSTASVPLTEAVDWASLAETVAPSVVTIQVSDGATGGEGTGVVLDAEGRVLTNNHVATAAGSDAEIRIVLSDGRVHSASVVGTDPSTDLAVLQVEDAPDDLVPATFGDSEQVVVGQQVMALGNPLGLSDTVTTGIVSALDRPVTTQAETSSTDPFDRSGQTPSQTEPVVTNAIQTDAAINPGNSGGPLVDAAGQVIGINSSIASSTGGSVGLGFAIPGDEASRIASELIADGAADHAWLGVQLGDATASADGATRQAAEVSQVVDGTPAEEAGLQDGDAVVAVDGEGVSGAESLTARVRAEAPGTEVVLTVVRDGGSLEVPVTLGTRPAED
ncbi:S1C family serine protease [Quadrisphaera sp. DSM 44207]|uniref:S1C family serine protease n=1 Tax=Quadrisphaera sp. DSM 44207 TaxID=1881057 RepID=UPI0008831C98|nr:trypsin-like peptidase domain-containing protein [Quadrisphaera sp. DSM 44207]SDQ65061.1 putative serine protease PepD [Quadrisphaera sp. DSM 44207]